MPTVVSDENPSSHPASLPLPPLDSRDDCAPEMQSTPAVPSRGVHNFVVMVLYQTAMRTGWIFKTESIIMPAVLDSLGGAAWLRGCLPLLNRFGQSVPPLLMSRQVKVAPRKKWILATCSLLMSIGFFALAALWLIAGPTLPWWTPLAFLAIYTAFFMSTGVNQLAFGALQGKLIETTYRGRLMLAANVVGAASAILAAWLLLPRWLHAEGGQFGMVFLVTAICFAVAALTAIFLSETPDAYRQRRQSVAALFGSSWSILRGDANFRRLAILSALFGSSVMLFPHYQALGREELHLPWNALITWVIVQNAGTGLFSLVLGPLADRRGNRLVLRILLLAVCAAPLTAIIFAQMPRRGEMLFPLVFCLVGMTPVVLKTLQNYTLEICPPSEHPRYLSTLNLCVAGPIFLSPLFGLLVDAAGFNVSFLLVVVVLLAGWLMTFGLQEPRHAATSNSAS